MAALYWTNMVLTRCLCCLASRPLPACMKDDGEMGTYGDRQQDMTSRSGTSDKYTTPTGSENRRNRRTQSQL